MVAVFVDCDDTFNSILHAQQWFIRKSILGRVESSTVLMFVVLLLLSFVILSVDTFPLSGKDMDRGTTGETEKLASLGDDVSTALFRLLLLTGVDVEYIFFMIGLLSKLSSSELSSISITDKEEVFLVISWGFVLFADSRETDVTSFDSRCVEDCGRATPWLFRSLCIKASVSRLDMSLDGSQNDDCVCDFVWLLAVFDVDTDVGGCFNNDNFDFSLEPPFKCVETRTSMFSLLV